VAMKGNEKKCKEVNPSVAEILMHQDLTGRRDKILLFCSGGPFADNKSEGREGHFSLTPTKS